MMPIRYQQPELMALLDALEQELLAAPAAEVRDAWRDAGRVRNVVCQEVRALLDEAITASEDSPAAMLPSDSCAGPGRLFGVSRQPRPADQGQPRAGAFSALSCRRH